MKGLILFNIWNVVYLFLVCAIIAGTLIITMLAGLRMAFFFKSFRDPINALKREPSIQDVVDVASEQDAIAGNRL
tara:strand:- start:477 stop:701 length:225 start_codon:yes stop_codon:yes gene_type:complete